MEPEGFGVFIMRVTLISLVLLLAGAQSSAAFEEQAAPSGATGPGSQIVDEKSAVGTDQGGGTVVAIPGLGKLGVIPKLDFGLELLYGAEEMKPELRDRVIDRPVEEDDGLRLRGSIKHRF